MAPPAGAPTSTSSCYYVTHVAPYHDGPAGVHGVLGQSAIAVAELAEAAGLDSAARRPMSGRSTHAELARAAVGRAVHDRGDAVERRATGDAARPA